MMSKALFDGPSLTGCVCGLAGRVSRKQSEMGSTSRTDPRRAGCGLGRNYKVTEAHRTMEAGAPLDCDGARVLAILREGPCTGVGRQRGMTPLAAETSCRTFWLVGIVVFI